MDYTSPIWDNVYAITVPNIATFDEYHIGNYGMKSSGVEAIDEALYREPKTIYVNIDKLLEYNRAGHRVTIKNRSDVLVIYDAIDTYLKHWLDYMNGPSLHTEQTPIDDLVALDALANELYPLVSDNYLDGGKASLARSSKLTNITNISNLFVVKEQGTHRKALDERASLSESLLDGGGAWR